MMPEWHFHINIHITYSVKIKDVICTLERFAPLPLQEDYDNAGLQVGLTEADVSGVLLCLDVTEQVVSEAQSLGYNMIVSHHPLIFHRLRHIGGESYVERCVMEAIKAGITIVSMHTNLDSAEGGVNYEIARRLGIEMSTVTIIEPREAEGVTGGACIVGMLPKAVTSEEYIRKVKEVFRVPRITGNELLQRPIQSIAICGGAGAFMLPQAVAAKADAFLTGEMHYHEYFAREQQIQITVIGHYESEQYTQQLLQDIIQQHCPGVKTVVTSTNTNPVRYY